MLKSIMFQGTASNVGKSLITAGFCRIFKEDGYKVVPFKSQNMALNSYITKEGLEMGRAQVFQAEAAGIEPDVRMNPILLKPTSNQSQVIILGKVYKNMNAEQYHDFKPELKNMIKKTYGEICQGKDIAVIEGAGSCAEINLLENDIVNMGMAEIADAPVILIGDIDRGGVFASLAGSIMLLKEEEKNRIKGVIINKFRGDIKILEPGIKMLEEIIKIPVLGVIPYSNIDIEDEDSLTQRFDKKIKEKKDIKIDVIKLPHISNFTDMNIFETQEDVNVNYVKEGESLTDPDMIIIPGSKNTIMDLLYLKESGLDKEIVKSAKKGNLIFGICGGYQILGQSVKDPLGVESEIKELSGLGLLDIETVFQGDKLTHQVEAEIMDEKGYLKGLKGQKIKGYEIHMGVSNKNSGENLSKIQKRSNKEMAELEGCVNLEGNVVGSYIHGIFDNLEFTRGVLNNIREKKGLDNIESKINSYEEYKDLQYTKLGQIIRDNVDMDKIYQILNKQEQL